MIAGMQPSSSEATALPCEPKWPMTGGRGRANRARTGAASAATPGDTQPGIGSHVIGRSRPSAYGRRQPSHAGMAIHARRAEASTTIVMSRCTAGHRAVGRRSPAETRCTARAPSARPDRRAGPAARATGRTGGSSSGSRSRAAPTGRAAAGVPGGHRAACRPGAGRRGDTMPSAACTDTPASRGRARHRTPHVDVVAGRGQCAGELAACSRSHRRCRAGIRTMSQMPARVTRPPSAAAPACGTVGRRGTARRRRAR